MYISRPLYELLPYAYALVGACLVAVSWFVRDSAWSVVLFIAGLLTIVAGLVIWLRRRDYRTTQAEYPVKSLED
jgi:sulfite exporter TauE/SafE